MKIEAAKRLKYGALPIEGSFLLEAGEIGISKSRQVIAQIAKKCPSAITHHNEVQLSFPDARQGRKELANAGWVLAKKNVIYRKDGTLPLTWNFYRGIFTVYAPMYAHIDDLGPLYANSVTRG